MKLSGLRRAIIPVVVIVAAISFYFILRKPAPKPLWTAEKVIQHLQNNSLNVDNVNTNYATLPQNLPKASTITCRVHVIFTIHDILNKAYPNNQLFICDSLEDEGTLYGAYETQVSQFVSFELYSSGAISLIDFLQGYDRQPTQSVLISNRTAHVTLVLDPAVTPDLATEYKIALLTLGMQYVGPSE